MSAAPNVDAGNADALAMMPAAAPPRRRLPSAVFDAVGRPPAGTEDLTLDIMDRA